MDMEIVIKTSIGLPQKEVTCFDTIHSKLATYEREYRWLKDGAFLLELALWKSKVDELDDVIPGMKEQCRVTCGADIIIPNVLPYLIAKEEGCAPLTVVRCNLN